VLPSAPSWSPDVEIWGTDDGNRIDLLLDGARVAEVYLRVDVRQLPNAFLNSVVKLAQRFDCLWVTADDMQVLEPGVRALAATIQNSEAARFVADPELFLDELSADES
jgi:hypothetical protein